MAKVAAILPDSSTVCEGKSLAWGVRLREPHVAWRFHQPCQRCGSDMGCQRCSGLPRELMCGRCKDWVTFDAVLEHGKILRTPEERAEGIKMLQSIIASRMQ